MRPFHTVFYFFTVLILCLAVLPAQEFWTPIEGPLGKPMNVASYLRTDPLGNVYIVYGFRAPQYDQCFRLKSQSTSFEPFNFFEPSDNNNKFPRNITFNFRSNGELFQIINDPVNGDTILRYDPVSKEWIRIWNGFPHRDGTFDDKEGIYVIYIDTTQTEPAYGVAVSHDNGKQWEYNLIESDVGDFSWFFRDNEDRFYVLHESTIYTSVDFCITWQPVQAGVLKFDRLFLCPDGTVITRTADMEMFRKAAASSEWERITVPYPDSVSGINFYGNSKGSIFLYLHSTLGLHSILKSSDKGETWKTIPCEHLPEGKLPGHAYGYYTTIAGNDDIILWFEGQVFLRSSNEGTTWEYLSKGLEKNGFYDILTDNNLKTIFGLTRHGVHLHYTENNGNDFSFLISPYSAMDYYTSVASCNKTDMYLSINKELFNRKDQVWRKCTSIDTGSPPRSLHIKKLAAGTDNTIYAATTAKTVHVSHDNAMTWQTIYTGIKKTAQIADMVVTGENTCMLVLDGNREVLRFDRAGSTWDTVSAGLPKLKMKQIGSTGDNHVFLLSAACGLYRNTATADSWEQVGVGIDDTAIMEFTIDKGNSLYASTGRVVFRSDDNGANWSRLDASYRDSVFHKLCVNGEGFLFAVDSLSGRMFRSIKVTGIKDIDSRNVMPDPLVSVKACKHHRTVTIQMNMPRTENTGVTIHRVDGKKVKDIVVSDSDSPFSVFTWNTQRYANGLYVIQVKSGHYRFTKTLLLYK